VLSIIRFIGLEMNHVAREEAELRSLGIEPKRRNALNDNEELDALISNIKQTYYQDFKTAYTTDLDKSHFDHII
jgi:hypothetical protein